MAAPETSYVRTSDGVHIAYQVLGDGPFDLVFSPAYISHLEWAWEDPGYAAMLRRLASFSRLIWFDRRGLGLSDRPERLPTLEDQAGDLAAVMDAAASHEAALFGDFDGCALAMMFAATHPERVRALVMLGTTDHIPEELQQTGQRMTEYARWVEHNWSKDDPVRISLAAPSRAEDTVFRKWFAQLCRLAASPSSVIEMGRIWALHDMRAVLPTIRVPTLVLYRDNPTQVGAKAVAAQIPGARLVVVPGVDAFSYTCATDALIDEVQEFLTGVREAPPVTRALATVLISDIVASTERATELGDRRWREVLDAHDRVLDRQLERFSGRKVNPTGDGAIATFDGPARAIRCGQALVDGVRALGLDVRVGLHTGEIELRGGDIGGIGVHIAARVAALAQAGEVLVSRTVTDLVAGSGISFVDRGEHQLKGVPSPWRLFAVEGSDG